MKSLPDRNARIAVLEGERQRKMARSAHAYVRGNTARFYEWLADAPAARALPDGPAIWICGDCHLGNLGPVADGRGRVEIEIRDLDQAVIGNPLHDLVRLGLSLATAARGSDLPGVVTAHMIEAMTAGYEAAMADPVAGDAGPEPDVVRAVRTRALGRRWRHLARERLEDVEPALPLGKNFWHLEADERAAVTALLDDEGVADLVLSLHGRRHGTMRLVDAAYWVKGCSSLGLLRVAGIAEIKGAGRRAHALMDIKEAVAPIAPAARDAVMPSAPGERVVAAARALSPYLGQRMAAGAVLNRSVFVRELKAQDLKLEVEQFGTDQAIKAARHLAFVVGRAHARQLDEADRRAWARELARGRARGLEAPSWLWEAVVALASRHESGYLEHCRQYALAA